MSKSSTTNCLPKHVAIVMDGNGRWAKKRMLPRTAGHQAGVKATRKIIECCLKKKIDTLTLFAFSSENWQRPEQEVNSLMKLFVKALSAEIDELYEQNVVVRFIGDRKRFPEKLQSCIEGAETKTSNNHGMKLNVAANYGGRWDIVNATKNIAAAINDNKLLVDDLTDEVFSRYLCLHDQPEPDLFIRSGGESRISNFLLWQLAYTELYFTDLLWPNFDASAFEDALSWFAQRQRRFGKTSKQILNT